MLVYLGQDFYSWVVVLPCRRVSWELRIVGVGACVAGDVLSFDINPGNNGRGKEGRKLFLINDGRPVDAVLVLLRTHRINGLLFGELCVSLSHIRFIPWILCPLGSWWWCAEWMAQALRNVSSCTMCVAACVPKRVLWALQQPGEARRQTNPRAAGVHGAALGRCWIHR